MPLSPPRIAIVAQGGVYPTREGGAAPTSPAGLWDLVARAHTALRDVPPGRWLLDPDAAFDPAVGTPDHVYSRRGCFVAPFAADPAGLDLPHGLLEQLDPVFHLTLEAGRQAWRSALTAGVDRSRVGVVLGAIVL